MNNFFHHTKPLCSGFGQFHTDNPNSAYPKPYLNISLNDIENMVKSPPSVAKDQARWVIFSSLLSRDAKRQRKTGIFYAVWIDIDVHTELAKIKAVLALLGCYYLVYSSRSSTHHKQKWRVIIALATPIYAEIVQQITEIINDKFEAAGITPDRASERINQICYLPNQGEFYQYHIEYKPYLDWQTVLARELTAKQQKALAEQQRIGHAKEQARIKAMQRIATNSLSPIQAFNQSYSVELCLELYHYKRTGKKYLSPNSQSGQAGVTVKDDKWFSSHASDSGIGKTNHNGTGCYGDAFDLFVYYEHGGNYKAAIKAAGAMFTTHTGTTLTKANQRHYMEQR